MTDLEYEQARCAAYRDAFSAIAAMTTFDLPAERRRAESAKVEADLSERLRALRDAPNTACALKDLLRRALPLIERAATEEARGNRAPTGLPPRTEKRDLLAEVKSALDN